MLTVLNPACGSSLQWRHNEHVGVSGHQSHVYLLNRLFSRRSKKTPKLRVTGLCVGNLPVTGENPAQRVSNAEKCFHLVTSSCMENVLRGLAQPCNGPDTLISSRFGVNGVRGLFDEYLCTLYLLAESRSVIIGLQVTFVYRPLQNQFRLQFIAFLSLNCCQHTVNVFE